MRTRLGMAVVFVLICGVAAADEKIDGTKLIGKWEPKKPKKGETTTIEFTKDGKLIVAGTIDDKKIDCEGVYKLDGDKLYYKLKFDDVTIEETVTIIKLTDDELEDKDKNAKSEAFRKVKTKP